MAPACARRRPSRVLRAGHGRPPRRRCRSFEEAVLPAMVLLARHQPGDPLCEARRGHGCARPVASGLLQGPADCRDPASHVSHVRRPRARPRSEQHAPRSGGCLRARAVALLLRRTRETTMGRAQGRDSPASSQPVPLSAAFVPKLLIITLSTGEAALPVLVRQLRRQSFQDFEHEIISGLPNRAAHNRLYRTIMGHSASFELFLKLDADMTLRSDASLSDALAATNGYADVQHFAFPVWDCFTDREILGVHLFRAGLSWDEITDDLFVDPNPPNARRISWQ